MLAALERLGLGRRAAEGAARRRGVRCARRCRTVGWALGPDERPSACAWRGSPPAARPHRGACRAAPSSPRAPCATPALVCGRRSPPATGYGRSPAGASAARSRSRRSDRGSTGDALRLLSRGTQRSARARWRGRCSVPPSQPRSARGSRRRVVTVLSVRSAPVSPRATMGVDMALNRRMRSMLILMALAGAALYCFYLLAGADFAPLEGAAPHGTKYAVAVAAELESVASTTSSIQRRSAGAETAQVLGGPGPFPALASHRSGRAQLTHPAPQGHGFAACGARIRVTPTTEGSFKNKSSSGAPLPMVSAWIQRRCSARSSNCCVIH